MTERFVGSDGIRHRTDGFKQDQSMGEMGVGLQCVILGLSQFAKFIQGATSLPASF